MKLKPILLSLLFTGLIVAGAQVEVPLGPVPFVLSDFFVLVAGLILGARYAALSIGLYVALGAVGLPVFAGGGGGLEHLFGPTGGYLFGFWVAGIVVGWLSHTGDFSLWKDAIATLSGQFCYFLLGVTWLKIAKEMEWGAAISAGFLGFWIPATIKFCAAVLTGNLLRRVTWFRIA